MRGSWGRFGAMADLNKVFLIGRLTKDPELRYTANGSPVTDLRLATSRAYSTKDGERREEQLFIDVTVWNRQAENCCQYLRKGRMVHVEGYLKMDTWDDKATGEKRSKIKVEADRVQFLDGGPRREDSGGPGESAAMDEEMPRTQSSGSESPRGRSPSGPNGNGNGNGSARPSAAANDNPPAPGRPAPSAETEEDEEDIPF